jgi:hypothetical protein
MKERAREWMKVRFQSEDEGEGESVGISACWENFVLPRSGEIRLAIRFPGTGVNTHTHTVVR